MIIREELSYQRETAPVHSYGLLFLGLSAETILFLSSLSSFPVKSLISWFVPAQHNVCLRSLSGQSSLGDKCFQTSNGRNRPWEMRPVGGFSERSFCRTPESGFAAPSEIGDAWTPPDAGLVVGE